MISKSFLNWCLSFQEKRKSIYIISIRKSYIGRRKVQKKTRKKETNTDKTKDKKISKIEAIFKDVQYVLTSKTLLVIFLR